MQLQKSGRALGCWIAISIGVCPILAADWPLGRFDSAGTGATAEKLPGEPKLLWELDLGGIGFDGSPVVADGAAFLADLSGRVFAIDLATGKERWRIETKNGFIASGAVANGRVYFGDDGGVVHVYDTKDGKANWEYATGSEIDASATFFGLNVLVTSQDGFLYCLSQKAGELKWKYETGDQLRCSATLAGSRTFLGGCDGKLHVVDCVTGQAAREPVPLDGPTGSTPSILGDSVFVPTHSGSLFAFDANSGEQRWQFSNSSLSQEFENNVAVANGLIVASSKNRRVFALDQTTGKVQWEVTLRKRCDASPIIAADKVVLAASDGRILFLDLKTGVESWRFEVKGAFLASPAVADGKLIVASDKGTVYCFGQSGVQ